MSGSHDPVEAPPSPRPEHHTDTGLGEQLDRVEGVLERLQALVIKFPTTMVMLAFFFGVIVGFGGLQAVKAWLPGAAPPESVEVCETRLEYVTEERDRCRADFDRALDNAQQDAAEKLAALRTLLDRCLPAAASEGEGDAVEADE